MTGQRHLSILVLQAEEMQSILLTNQNEQVQHYAMLTLESAVTAMEEIGAKEMAQHYNTWRHNYTVR
jgi:hypothetical protein